MEVRTGSLSFPRARGSGPRSESRFFNFNSPVPVTATLGVRDWSDNWDDDYEGTVYFAVLAELA